jgi:hypothetical protein
LHRAKAIVILEEMSKQGASPSKIVLKEIASDSYELQIEPQVLDIHEIKIIVEKHNLKAKEDNGLIVVS